MKKAVVLLSGGLDSTTTLFLAKQKGYNCFCLIFDYGQRHKKEIDSARRIAESAKCKYEIIKFKLPWGGSVLLEKTSSLPGDTTPALANAMADRHNPQRPTHIPPTYVPARNTIFLSFALSYAEAMGVEAIFIGANQIDFSGYPDCRLGYYQAFQKVIKKGTRAGVEGRQIKILTPLIKKTKAEIIQLGTRLGVPFGLTWSCYRGGRRPCGGCESCLFRAKGFREAGVEDPLLRKRVVSKSDGGRKG